NVKDCVDFGPPPGGAYHPDCNTTLNMAPNLGRFPGANDVWQCVEVHIKLNTITGGVANRDGIAETYFGGVLVTQYANMAFQPWQGNAPVQFSPLMLYRQGA